MTTLLLPSDRSGCGHYRIGNAAALAGDAVRLTWPDSVDLPDVTLAESGLDGLEHLVDVQLEPGIDVVVMQRPTGRLMYEAMRLLQERGVRVVVEMDDDLFRIRHDNDGWKALDPTLNPDSNVEWLRKAMEAADWRIFSTPELYESYGQTGDWVVPNYVPKSLLEVEAEREWEGVRIGWGGWTGNHPGDLEVAKQAMKRTIRELDGRFYVVGPREGPAPFENQVAKALGISRYTVYATGWVTTPAYPVSVAGSFNLGVVPLARNLFNRSKSWLKGLEYSALGVACVASPTPEYRRLAQIAPIRLAEGPAEWLSHLKWLAKHPDAVLEAGKASREAILAADLTVEAHFGEFVAAWTAPKPMLSYNDA